MIMSSYDLTYNSDNRLEVRHIVQAYAQTKKTYLSISLLWWSWWVLPPRPSVNALNDYRLSLS